MLRLKRSPEVPEKQDELGALGWLEVYGETKRVIEDHRALQAV